MSDTDTRRAAMAPASELDPFSYEVIRHRLANIVLEGATALQHVSGSPLATEAFDMNTSIMSAHGEVAFVGPYLLTGPMSQGMIARRVMETAASSSPIEPGDVFLCNDPYSGSVHQNCVTLVGPIHHSGSLVAWCGATLHVVDVGGSTVGQVGIGARSILDEAPVTPPTRIVRDTEVVAEVEQAYLARSRTPALNALDLRAKLAAVNTIRARVVELCDREGSGRVSEAIEHTIDRGASHLRRRLRELPDIDVSTSAFLDHEQDGKRNVFEVRLHARKRGESLALDFSSSSDQAPAIINCTSSGLRSGVMVGLLATLVWDSPWCPAAIERVVSIESRPGTLVDASYPAGCSMATMAAGFAVTTATAQAVGELLLASTGARDHAMASWAGAVGSVDVFGADATGRPFGTVLLDSMATGTGATSGHDGLDAGGFLRSIGCVVSNVEQYEERFPLLYLWRRNEPDSGGAGRLRGGTGVGFAVMPHAVDRLATVSPHFAGTLEPESSGLDGGFPGARNRVLVAASSGVLTQLRDGFVPMRGDELSAPPTEIAGLAGFTLEADGVLEIRTAGGGGWGDPLERDPALVATDLRSGRITLDAAHELYGVVVADDGTVDERQTDRERAAIRDARRSRASVGAREVPAAGPCPTCGSTGPLIESDLLARLDAALAGQFVQPDAPFTVVERTCTNCGRVRAAERRLIPDRVSPGA